MNRSEVTSCFTSRICEEDVDLQDGVGAADWMAAGEGGAQTGSVSSAGGAGRESSRERRAGGEEQSPS